ncbi:2-amino-4-hydroxy-6-hydroxymethyldihydropteridine diphosphokinase [Candidatus Omnitrophota bacterium]
MSVAYIGVGSNLGNREEHINKALDLLDQEPLQILKRSKLIETNPVGGPPQGKFLNGVIKIKTKLSPKDLLTLCHSIEEKCGRIRTIKHGPRPIDLDILLYDSIICNSKQLTIPHPRMLDRDFVMIPLCEIEPSLVKELKKCAS